MPADLLEQAPGSLIGAGISRDEITTGQQGQRDS